MGNPNGNPKHRMRNSPEYISWVNMRQRCNNPKNPNYKYYGERGISVCKEWDDFSKFYKDMGACNGGTLDRIDNEKGYFKSNCRWANDQIQSANRRNCINITFKNKTQTLSEWARELNMPKGTLYKRWCAKWEIKRMLTK